MIVRSFDEEGRWMAGLFFMYAPGFATASQEKAVLTNG